MKAILLLLAAFLADIPWGHGLSQYDQIRDPVHVVPDGGRWDYEEYVPEFRRSRCHDPYENAGVPAPPNDPVWFIELQYTRMLKGTRSHWGK